MKAKLPMFFGVAALHLPGAFANVTYTYLGHTFDALINDDFTAPMYSPDDFVSGSFVLPTYLPPHLRGEIQPLSFSFSDGIGTINSLNGLLAANVETDAIGEIVAWTLSMTLVDHMTTFGYRSIYTSSAGPFGRLGDFASICGECEGGVFNFGGGFSPGTWSVQSTVPEPQTVFLIFVGLAVAALFKRFVPGPRLAG